MFQWIRDVVIVDNFATALIISYIKIVFYFLTLYLIFLIVKDILHRKIVVSKMSIII